MGVDPNSESQMPLRSVLRPVSLWPWPPALPVEGFSFTTFSTIVPE